MHELVDQVLWFSCVVLFRHIVDDTLLRDNSKTRHSRANCANLIRIAVASLPVNAANCAPAAAMACCRYPVW